MICVVNGVKRAVVFSGGPTFSRLLLVRRISVFRDCSPTWKGEVILRMWNVGYAQMAFPGPALVHPSLHGFFVPAFLHFASRDLHIQRCQSLIEAFGDPCIHHRSSFETVSIHLSTVVPVLMQAELLTMSKSKSDSDTQRTISCH